MLKPNFFCQNEGSAHGKFVFFMLSKTEFPGVMNIEMIIRDTVRQAIEQPFMLRTMQSRQPLVSDCMVRNIKHRL